MGWFNWTSISLRLWKKRPQRWLHLRSITWQNALSHMELKAFVLPETIALCVCPEFKYSLKTTQLKPDQGMEWASLNWWPLASDPRDSQGKKSLVGGWGDRNRGFQVNSLLLESLSFGNILSKLKGNDLSITERKGIVSLQNHFNFKIIGWRAVEHSSRLIPERRDPTSQLAIVSPTIIIMCICPRAFTFYMHFPLYFSHFVIT